MPREGTSYVVYLVIALILIAGGISIFVLYESVDLGNNTTTTTTTTTVIDDGFEPLENILAETFDGTGFGNTSGSSASVESTLNAAELIHFFDLSDSAILHGMINATFNEIMSMHHPNGGFREDVYDLYPDRKVTALYVRTIRLLGLLDMDIHNDMIDFFLHELGGPLSYERWINDGILDEKYWVLRVAYEIDFTQAIGLMPITLDNVFEQGEDPGIGTDPVLWVGELYYGQQFDAESYDDRLMILECFEYMIRNPLHRPIIFGLLVNESSTVNQLATMYNDTSGLVNNNLKDTWTAFRTLTNTGNLSLIFDAEHSDERLSLLQERIDSVVDIENGRANPNATISEILVLTKISNIIDYNLNHGFIQSLYYENMDYRTLRAKAIFLGVSDVDAPHIHPAIFCIIRTDRHT
ncbi:MAG: hypothetical protein ACXACD_08060 [Candidatus Thorarchaeota archaeon]|jgi:hypothetical protein